MATLTQPQAKAHEQERLGSPRTRRKKHLFVALLVVASVATCEVIARLALITLRGPITFQSDPTLGFRYRPDLDVHRVRLNCDWTFTTDDQGYRVTPNNPGAAEHPTLVLLGDSFAFGDGVSNHETLAAALAQRGVHVVNLGVTGYGSHQQLLALRDYLSKSTPPDWIVTLTYTNDETDVLSSYQSMHHQPHAFLGEAQLKVAPFATPLADRLADHSYLCALVRAVLFNSAVRHEGDGSAIVAACLSGIEAEASQAGARTLFLAHDAVEPERIGGIVNAAMARDVPVIDLSPMFVDAQHRGEDLICPDEEHWNEAGGACVARVILDHITTAAAPVNRALAP